MKAARRLQVLGFEPAPSSSDKDGDEDEDETEELRQTADENEDDKL